MKTMRFLIPIVLLALLHTSCSKKEGVEPHIQGKWQMQEVYNGYANGGDFKWSVVPSQHQSKLEFFDNGTFIQSQPVSVSQCSGTYQLTANNEIEFTSNCYTTPLKLKATISNGGLIITYPVREGEIKEKYTKVN